MNKARCKKDLHKSTYKQKAFVQNKEYPITEETDKFYYIGDEKNHPTNFAKENHGIFYFFNDYFELV